MNKISLAGLCAAAALAFGLASHQALAMSSSREGQQGKAVDVAKAKGLLTDEELKLVKEKGKIEVCGKTGEIKGTERHKLAANAPKCPETGWNVGSFNHRIIAAHDSVIMGDDSGPFLSVDEMAKVKSGEDFTICHDCGDIVGSARYQKKDQIKNCPETGWNVDSMRHRLIQAHDNFIMGDDSGPNK